MYQWLVFLHLVGLVLFAAAHGISAYTAFRIRQERDPRIVASHLGASKIATGPMYVGLLLLAIGGLGAAGAGGLLLAPWVIASYVVLVAVLVVMYTVATRYYVELRQLVGDGSAPVDRSALEAALDSRRPEILALVGFGGLLVLIWLMVIKPG